MVQATDIVIKLSYTCSIPLANLMTRFELNRNECLCLLCFMGSLLSLKTCVRFLGPRSRVCVVRPLSPWAFNCGKAGGSIYDEMSVGGGGGSKMSICPELLS